MSDTHRETLLKINKHKFTQSETHTMRDTHTDSETEKHAEMSIVRQRDTHTETQTYPVKGMESLTK